MGEKHYQKNLTNKQNFSPKKIFRQFNRIYNLGHPMQLTLTNSGTDNFDKCSADLGPAIYYNFLRSLEALLPK